MHSHAAPPATPANSSTPAAAPAAAARPAWLAWLARAVGTPAVPISGFTHPTNAFATPYRVINWHACIGCWSDPRVRFDHKDFLWCPCHAGTPRQFECTRLITAEQVKQTIECIPGVRRQSVASDDIARNRLPTGRDR
jgi:hypothetical protein